MSKTEFKGLEDVTAGIGRDVVFAMWVPSFPGKPNEGIVRLDSSITKSLLKEV